MVIWFVCGCFLNWCSYSVPGVMCAPSVRPPLLLFLPPLSRVPPRLCPPSLSASPPAASRAISMGFAWRAYPLSAGSPAKTSRDHSAPRSATKRKHIRAKLSISSMTTRVRNTRRCPGPRASFVDLAKNGQRGRRNTGKRGSVAGPHLERGHGDVLEPHGVIGGERKTPHTPR